MEDATPLTVQYFRGHFDRGLDEVCPPEYAIDELNCEYSENGVKTRAGTDLVLSSVVGGWNGKALRVFEYKKRNEASRLLILDDGGRIYDSSTSMLTPILSIAAMSDFSAATIFDRVYISPHDGDRGLSNEKIYIYDGTGTARVAAGDPPSGYTLAVVDNAASGNIEAGTHLFSVAFETASGHITKMGLTGAEVKNYTAPGSKKADISGIPLGPAGTAARIIVCTKVILNYDGNPADKEWFILPNGRIGDNTTTTLTGVSFFDSDLLDSAERLLNQLATIPAGACIANFANRLVVGGEIANDSTVRVSEVGYPESISGLEGFINVDPGDNGGPVHNLVEFRDFLYIQKDQRTYVTQDNGASPRTWKCPQIDGALGTSVHGTAGVLDSKGHTHDQFLIATRAGLYKFIGAYGADRELSYTIRDIWERINGQYFYKLQIAVDPIKKFVVVSVPLDSATEVSHILFGDFSEGLDWQNTKWSIWSYPKKPTTCWVEVDFTTKASILKFGSSEGGTYKRNSSTLNDFGTAINSYYRPAFLTADPSGSVCYFKALRLRGKGAGNLDLTVYGLDDAKTAVLSSLVLAASPGQELYRLMDFAGERASVKFGVDAINEWFYITAFRVFANVLFEEQIQS